MCDLADLHDASLRSITVDVDGATASLALELTRTGAGPHELTLVAHGWRALSVPKREPWGRAAVWYVNEVRGPWAIASGLQRVEIEMQSGDVLEIEAATIQRINAHGET